MHQAKKDFLNLIHWPARLSLTETACFLGFAEHGVSVLASGGLLKPLGRPASSGLKYFSAAALDDLRTDSRWLVRESDAVVAHWWQKNSERKKASAAPVLQAA